ncbi:MAG: hypothetical protein CL878_10100 [Dehalococcoidia bacterium]|nr:hypothetical protein [Dehalococcoidia bacterium]
MPRELVTVAPRTPGLREYEEPLLGDTQIRIRTEFAAPKHGTEMVSYRAERTGVRYDAEWGYFVPAPPKPEAEQTFQPARLGNMATGAVVEAGAAVTKFSAGDRIFGHLPIRETHTVEARRVDLLPAGLTPQAAVCLDPLVMALPVRESGIRLGDRVAVFGLGAIGQMAVQLARIAGADQVIAVDPIKDRRDLALALGADATIDPLAGDVGQAIRELTVPGSQISAPTEPFWRGVGGYTERPTQWGQRGVDVAVEVSGNSTVLHDAIRATRFGGTVCVISFYGRDASGVHLGHEFHVNQLSLVSVRAESLPLRDYPAWDLQRLADMGLRWLLSGRVKAEGIVSPIVPFEESAAAYADIDLHPEKSIKLGITFS